MDVKVIKFPETKVAVIEHVGKPELEHDSVRKLIAWKIENGLTDALKYRHYGIHFTNPKTVNPDQNKVDFCLSVDFEIEPNSYGVKGKTIPCLRCAVARDVGSRSDNKAVGYLIEQWLPNSGEFAGEYPVIFHYMNVGPQIKAEDMVTDVYLPLR